MMRTLTRKGAATRQRILEGAAALIREHGVADTTLDDVLAGTATSKSQLFHYFPGGREELLLAVARLEADRVLEDQRPQLGDLTSWPAWQAWRDKVVDRYRRQGRLCPLNSVTSHLGSRTPGAQAVVTELMRSWQAEIAAGVRHMRDAGEIGPDVDPDRVAAALLAGIQGGVLIQMSTGETTHLEAALDMGLAHLRAGRAQPGRVADGL
ncbi:TetR/AcrR family transcriptional regulator [Microbispora tritici]|uniref:TetR/AcrR family transcriptional regulator n=3 Tax=Streptosporangiaceae TaxID=2004 RepID=A0ABY3LP03_9ACTN|nr:TetR/AcrR family transcriptional regulator [Microbispora fusca]TYB45779.1 TetR/AcrR family transcriptional regulator [Microbispora tritici]